MAVEKDWLPPLRKNVARGREVYLYPDGTTIEASLHQIHGDGEQVVLYRAGTRRFGRGWVEISEVPRHLQQYLYAVNDNEWQDAFFRSPYRAAEMLHWLGLGPADVA